MKTSPRLNVAIAFFALIVAGCITPTPVHKMTTPFEESDFEPSMRKGTATIAGQAFAKTRGGDVKFAAANVVELFPVNAYTREAMAAAISGAIPQNDARLQRYVRRSTADGNGNFEFRNLPAGDYFLECGIFWEISGPPYRTGGMARKTLSVEDGEAIKVILTL